MKDFLKKVKDILTCVFTRHISSIFVGICLTLCSIVILYHHFSPTTSMALCPFTVIGVTLIFIVANSHAYKKSDANIGNCLIGAAIGALFTILLFVLST